MRKSLSGCLIVAALAVISGQDLAAARIVDHINSGYCPHNLRHVANLRVCIRFAADGHRISWTDLIPLQEFRKYGVANLP
jgi:hypothetical protein